MRKLRLGGSVTTVTLFKLLGNGSDRAQSLVAALACPIGNLSGGDPDVELKIIVHDIVTENSPVLGHPGLNDQRAVVKRRNYIPGCQGGDIAQGSCAANHGFRRHSRAGLIVERGAICAEGLLEARGQDDLTAGADTALTGLLERWSQSTARPIGLMLDEVDMLVGDTLIALLRQIRAGYAQRPGAFPQTIILCGVRDYRMHTTH